MTKIMLYRGGKQGVEATLPCITSPEDELCIVLGGPVFMLPLTERLTLVTLEDAPKLKLPFRYIAHLADMSEPEPVPGDAAVIAIELPNEEITSITDKDKFTIISERLIEPLKQ